MKKIPASFIFALRLWAFLLLPAVLFFCLGAYFLAKSQENSLKVYFQLPERYSALRALVMDYKQIQLKLEQNYKKPLHKKLKTNPFFSPALTASARASFSKIPSFQKEFRLEMVLKFESSGKGFCVINDKLYEEGDKLFQNLKIKKIGDYYVELKAGKRVVRLKVGDTYLYTF